jgi:hypothetical protein
MTHPPCKILRKTVHWELGVSLRTDGQRDRPDEADNCLLQLFLRNRLKRIN